MNIVLWIIFGAIAGWIASLVTRTDAQQGVIMDIILGIVGSVVGGLVMSTLGFSGVDGFNLYSLAVAVLGSIAVISIGKLLRRA